MITMTKVSIGSFATLAIARQNMSVLIVALVLTAVSLSHYVKYVVLRSATT